MLVPRQRAGVHPGGLARRRAATAAPRARGTLTRRRGHLPTVPMLIPGPLTGFSAVGLTTLNLTLTLKAIRCPSADMFLPPSTLLLRHLS